MSHTLCLYRREVQKNVSRVNILCLTFYYVKHWWLWKNAFDAKMYFCKARQHDCTKGNIQLIGVDKEIKMIKT